ncbi:hypothetical protein SLEP1_g37243 [Rubroshorea leprosula]|uniref:Uncharacterized protein n=1 Tax=Rubroshorea leprosula TaxID=152421 RepID=A0AAV5KU82_9ROSI|nr:hypothetical protein SLEP1_g37243 [Rubroshorea leprosula]
MGSRDGERKGRNNRKTDGETENRLGSIREGKKTMTGSWKMQRRHDCRL